MWEEHEKDADERREGVKITKANCLGGTVDSYGGGWLEGGKLHHWIPFKWVESFDPHFLAKSADSRWHCRTMLTAQDSNATLFMSARPPTMASRGRVTSGVRERCSCDSRSS